MYLLHIVTRSVRLRQAGVHRVLITSRGVEVSVVLVGAGVIHVHVLLTLGLPCNIPSHKKHTPLFRFSYTAKILRNIRRWTYMALFVIE